MTNEAGQSGARDVVINIRANRYQRELIDRAADSRGKNRSDFMLEAACREAESVLLDRRYFTLDADAFAEFTKRLDAPPLENESLRKLLKTPAPWE
jgi:uncharacterized protein (DUF1778 family)